MEAITIFLPKILAFEIKKQHAGFYLKSMYMPNADSRFSNYSY